MKTRNDLYDIPSIRVLRKFFGHFLHRNQIDAVIRKCRIEFIKRNGSDNTESNLQFLKKCEYELSRLTKNNHS